MARAACVAVVVLVGSVVAGTGSAAGQRDSGTRATDTRLAYSCQFPSGAQQVSLEVAATFPATARVNEPIQPADVTMTLAVPQAALGDLTKLDAATVTSNPQFNVAVTQSGAATNATWSALSTPSTPIPSSGDLVLTASGPVPPITASTAGDVTFTAADLALVLTPDKPDGSATDPALMPLACTPNPNQNAQIALVSMPGAGTPTAAGQPKPTRPPGHPGMARPGAATAGPAAGRTQSPHSVTPRDTTGIPPDCGDIPVIGFGAQGCALLAGFSTVSKLKGSVLVGPGPMGEPKAALVNIEPYDGGSGCVPPDLTLRECRPNGGVVHAFQCTIAQLDYRGKRELPPAKASFLAFGSLPTTAVIQLTEVAWPTGHGPTEDPRCGQSFGTRLHQPFPIESPVINIVSDLPFVVIGGQTPLQKTTAETYVSVRLFDVALDGVPLDVGPHCQTSQPVHLTLDGEGDSIKVPPTGYTIAFGGPLNGTVTIPPFTGCGVGEELDPLFTGLVSGPGNPVKLIQGTLCALSTGIGCPPTVPEPEH